MITWNNFVESLGEGDINPATGKPIMTFDMYRNVQISFMRNGAEEEYAGFYVFDDPETREKATQEALKFYPQLGYEFSEKDEKFIVQLTGE